MPATERLRDLLMRYSTDNTTSEQEEELFVLLRLEEDADLELLFEEMLGNAVPMYDATRAKRILAKVFASEELSREKKSKVVSIWKKMAVAAGLAGILWLGYFLVNRPSAVTDPAKSQVTFNDVKAPDKNRASIRLADGRIVYLDSAENGELAMQQGVKVIKAEDGSLEYNGQLSMVNGQLEYNTLINPRGSQVINMTLSDGSKVWLNAGSAITYPVAFTGEERKVEIKGEGYFEVAHNAKMPFIVTNGDVQVKVLGTHFNVNAYEDEGEVRITLLEGSVGVRTTDDGRQSILKPGEQARSMVNGQWSIDKDVDTEQVMAWKNGRFEFKSTDIATIMREVARWYDVEIVYSEQVSQRFNGKIPRTMSAMNVFKVLEETGGVHFKIEGKKVIVSK